MKMTAHVLVPQISFPAQSAFRRKPFEFSSAAAAAQGYVRRHWKHAVASLMVYGATVAVWAFLVR